MPRAPRVAAGRGPAGTLPRTSFGAAEARLSRREQDRFSYQMGRLLAVSAAAFGLIGTVVSLVILWIPGVLAPGQALVASIPLVLLAAAHTLAAWRPRDFLIVAVVSLGFVSLLVIGVLMDGAWNVGSSSAMGLIAALGIGGVAAVLVVSWREIILGAVAFMLTIALYLALLAGTPANLSGGVALIITGWGVAATFGGWLGASFPRVMRRIGRIGRAYNIERRASETEARRLRDARLLHDTALATLTLLAHSGVGVNGEALRRQAESDGELLRRLRLGETPQPEVSGDYSLTTTAEVPVGASLAGLRSRLDGRGLEIDWHGAGEVDLPPEHLEAFVLALSECLENVRRHAQVTRAHVTLSDDETAARAVVTDAGVGFDPDEIPGGRLGFRESVIARLDDIGGTVRVFSARGAGTTVVLEVTKQ